MIGATMLCNDLYNGLGFYCSKTFTCLMALFLSLPPQGMALHQKVVGEQSGPSNQAQSFLAQQRQSTHARRGLAARHQPR